MNRRGAIVVLSSVGTISFAGCLDEIEELSRSNDPEEVKENAKTVEYEELYRNISGYEGEPIHFSAAKITDIPESDDGYQEYIIRVVFSDGPRDDPEYVYGIWEGDPHREGDTIDIWGIVNGTTTYMSLSGEQTVPEIDLVGIELAE